MIIKRKVIDYIHIVSRWRSRKEDNRYLSKGGIDTDEDKSLWEVVLHAFPDCDDCAERLQ